MRFTAFNEMIIGAGIFQKKNNKALPQKQEKVIFTKIRATYDFKDGQ